ncbi:GTP-binding protein rho1 precursor [Macrophomina phaseolina MS6]|uniref:GTP-binding protein rho1 n=1 Tax=Macrophomina phaseolina (strain MS6) TaxID=1126212 RepID=K2S9M5_MACPH|nr:GTP-binding protein rho1 precursor [Macrophomina phaseolina MS6]
MQMQKETKKAKSDFATHPVVVEFHNLLALMTHKNPIFPMFIASQKLSKPIRHGTATRGCLFFLEKKKKIKTHEKHNRKGGGNLWSTKAPRRILMMVPWQLNRDSADEVQAQNSRNHYQRKSITGTSKGLVAGQLERKNRIATEKPAKPPPLIQRSRQDTLKPPAVSTRAASASEESIAKLGRAPGDKGLEAALLKRKMSKETLFG